MKIKCQQCGGTLSIEPSDILKICPYCGSHLIVSNGETFSHKILKESISLREAKQKIYVLFVSKFGESININDIFLSYIPFAEISGDNKFLSCLAPSYCEMFFVPYNLSIPSGEYRFFEEADFEISDVVLPEKDLNSFVDEYGRDSVKGITYIPFYLVNCEYMGERFSFSIDAYIGDLYCPFLEAITPLDDKKDHLSKFAIHFFVPFLLVFPFYFIFKNNSLNVLGLIAFFYSIYLFYLEEKRDE